MRLSQQALESCRGQRRIEGKKGLSEGSRNIGQPADQPSIVRDDRQWSIRSGPDAPQQACRIHRGSKRRSHVNDAFSLRPIVRICDQEKTFWLVAVPIRSVTRLHRPQSSVWAMHDDRSV
jgi:hypothetical protein